MSIGERFVWTFATASGGINPIISVEAEVLDVDGKLVSNHRLLQLDQRDYTTLTTFDDYTPSRSHYVRVYADESENRIFSKRDDERATINIFVVDDAGNVVSSRRQRLNANRDQLQIQTASVDRDGRAYVLAKVFANKRGRELRGQSDAKLMLYTLDAGAEDVVTTELTLDGQYIEGVGMVSRDDGSPTIVGLYSDRIGRRVRGYFASAGIGGDTKLRPKEFNQRMLEKMGRRITSRVGGELALENGFEFRDALSLSNGRLSLLLEYYTEIRNNNFNNFNNPGFGGRMETTFVYGEGLVLNFAADGDLEDAVVVPKYQTANVPGLPYMRMNLVEYDGRAAVIYNDNPKNFTRDLNKRTKPLRFNDALAVLGYDSDGGRLQRIPLFARKDAGKVIIIPSSATRLADDRVLFLATRYKFFGNNELRFGVIDAPR